jgi:hypothetical protein
MKNLVLITSILIIVLALQACGSSSKKSPTPTTPTTPTTPPTTPTIPEAVHHIQPEDVAQYVEKYKAQQAAVELQIDGSIYTVSFVDMDQENNLIFAQYDKGFLFFGFDFENNQPVDFIRVVETELEDINEALADTDNYFFGKDISVSQDDNENAIYEGSISHPVKGDFSIKLTVNESLIEGGTSTVEVSGTIAMVNGDLGTKTYVQITDLINNHPEVDTLLLQEISGSVNDAINMHTGRLVRNAQLTTMVEATSDVNSGGVDLYTSGFKRVYTEGAKLGVHSWCCTEGKPADELGRDHEGHGAQLTFFREMLGAELGPEFYFFTIEAAPHNTVHVMTKAELDKYLLQ